MGGYPDVTIPTSGDVYRTWLHKNPRGFVVTAWKDPSQVAEEMRGMTWHRAGCDTIRAPGVNYVTGATMLIDDVVEGWRDMRLDDPDWYEFYMWNAARSNTTVPPVPPEKPFDLSNSEHFDALAKYLEYLCED
jgi:hypothetical protein